LLRNLVKDYSDVHIFIRKTSNIWRISDLMSSVNVHYVDITKFNLLNDLIYSIHPKTIFHLAAYGAYPFQTNFNKIQSCVFNGTKNLLNACKNIKVSCFINTGSNSEYGFKNKPMKENDYLKPNSYYSIFKSATSLLCQYEALSNNLNIITVRPFHVYGPYEEPTRFIPTLIMNVLDNKLPQLVNSNISRDMIYIDDVIEFYKIMSTKKNISGQIFNLGTGCQSTIKDIVKIVLKNFDLKIEPNWGSMKNRIWDQTTWVANMDKVKNEFNWQSQINLKQGLNETIDWFKKNKSLYRNKY